jgi:asparagine synthase (glutamine-hydrolysing)
MPRRRAEAELARMVDKLRHDASYSAGTWVDEAAGVYVGWVARKGSFSDGMPLLSRDGTAALVFSGEEFSGPAAAHDVQSAESTGGPEGPTYLLELYMRNRPGFPACLNGWFHGLAMDRKRGAVELFTDRYGMQRLYFHEAKGTFYFGAEAKAILGVKPELRVLDPRGLGEWAACGCVLENRTLFKDIYIVPPASAWRFSGKTLVDRGRYFSPEEWENQDPLTPEAYYAALREAFAKNLPRYFNGGQRAAVSLTGGLDTRAIMAWQRQPPGSLPCYTFGGMYRESQDVRVARQVAQACGQPHEVIGVDGHFLAKFPGYAERTVYLTDGCVDVGHAPDLYANEKAKEIAPVRVTGNYGGEVLRCLRVFRPQAVGDVYHGDLLPHLHEASRTYAALLRVNPVSFAVFRQAPWRHYGLLSLEQTQVSLRSPFLDNELIRTVFRGPRSAFENDNIYERLIGDGSRALTAIRTDRCLGGAGIRAGAAFRAPLTLVRKAEYAYDYGMPHWLARVDRMLSPLRVERLFLGWNKFCHFRVWYKDHLSRYVREMLLDSRTRSRPYIRPSRLEAAVQRHLQGTENRTREIHQVLTLELLHRLLVDGT